jgi:hypothetical protein
MPKRRPSQIDFLSGSYSALEIAFAVIVAIALPYLRAQAQSPALPTTKEVVARYDQALGGEAALRRHTSSTTRGTTEVHTHSGVLTLSLVYYAAAPYHRLEKVSLPNNQGDVLNGFDGETAWSFDPRGGGPQVYSGDERESAKRDADFYYPLTELSWFKSMEVVGVEDFEGQSCYRLHGFNNWDKSNDHFYDVKTGLLAGYEFPSDFGLAHEIFSDYRKLDGVLAPMKQVFKVKSKDTGEWKVIQVLTFTSITFNDVDPAVFTPPQSVRDLLAKPKP